MFAVCGAVWSTSPYARQPSPSNLILMPHQSSPNNLLLMFHLPLSTHHHARGLTYVVPGPLLSAACSGANERPTQRPFLVVPRHPPLLCRRKRALTKHQIPRFTAEPRQILPHHVRAPFSPGRRQPPGCCCCVYYLRGQGPLQGSPSASRRTL